MTVIDAYRERVRDGALKPDPAQEAVAAVLSRLADDLNAAPPGRDGFVRRLLGRRNELPKGLYIHGEVGRGKTMLMDLFVSQVTAWPKQRIHFHAFMQDVHARRQRLGGDDVIGSIARELAAQARLLCLDEMQIVDIADAMIIGRLYDALRGNGVVVVTTSNLPPRELYKDGLNRQLFLPFIERIESTMNVVSLDSQRDYRLGRIRARETFLHPATAENRVAFNELWRDLTDGAAGKVDVLEVLGRKLTVPKAAHGCASFTFQELCGEALGPPDYLAITRAYRTVFLSGVPKLKAHQRNETKRFILMIDTFYDAGTRLVALADATPENLFPKNQHAFESRRTVSRLKEMQSAGWWGNSAAIL
ncbi:MAG: cell division protein ZapE [Proteobacteria bacterium]|nr:cell division protein ZapE [Pseudomonadota bacterium]